MKAIYLQFILGLLFLTACSNETPERSIAHRTVLVYVAGDNNLSAYGKRNIQSMINGAGSNHLNGGNLVVYYDAADAAPLLLQVKVGNEGTAYTDTLQRYPEQNSMDPQVMREVIHEVQSAFPAQKQGLVLWSHGTAWLPYPLSNYLRSFGDDQGEVLSIDELASALPDHTFDFILFDACYMGSWEVLYALRNKADYLIASPTEVLADGFVYDYILQPMFQQPADLEQVCRLFYNHYNSLTGLSRSGAIALYDLQALPALAACCQTILQDQAEALLQVSPSEVQAVDYLSAYHHFLFDLADVVRQVATDPDYEAFELALQQVIRYKATTPYITFGYSGNPQIAMQHYSGLSLYLPQANHTQLNDWYSRQTAWGRLLSGL